MQHPEMTTDEAFSDLYNLEWGPQGADTKVTKKYLWRSSRMEITCLNMLQCGQHGSVFEKDAWQDIY